MALSPMMIQYQQIKENHSDCIVMTRIGDFYEMFFDDAKLASRELDLVLTGKDCGMEERAPMCGVPYHALDQYLSKLVAKGYRVAIVEQLEDPATAKGLVKRDVIRIVTPGTVTEGGFLQDRENNYIAAVTTEQDGFGLAFADVSTGEIYAVELLGDRANELLISEMAAYSPSEVLFSNGFPEELQKQIRARYHSLLTAVEDAENPASYQVAFRNQFADVETESYASAAVGMMLCQLEKTQKTDLSYLKVPVFYEVDNYLGIDNFSRRNLELCETIRSGERKGSLLGTIDRTKTSAGGRLLKKWIEKPLLNCAAIRARQKAVQALFDDSIVRDEMMHNLRSCIDIERLSTKLVYGSANARDLKALEHTLVLLPEIKKQLDALQGKSTLLDQINGRINPLEEVAESIFNTIDEDPSMVLKEGGIIKPGCNASVDELRLIMSDGKSWISKIEETEREKTGIRTLKVGYNRVFGYYIEVSKSFVEMVPEEYIRKQTLTTGERYVTPELKDMESKVIGAKDRDCQLEYELFAALRSYVLNYVNALQESAAALSELDVLCSFAEVARECGYVCPEVDQSDRIEIKNGRHPVVEKFLDGTYFVPNDCLLDNQNNRLLLITGPNMAGKSTYMRQVALIVLMAQIGSFVPASSARIGIVDRIFTRIGASDDLASGTSTFMLEMNEVAEILKNATKRSLIIYDEIGRGTSTYDGMSIAKAVVEHTCTKVGAKTLFATHYHELTDLEGTLPGILNYHIAAKKRGNDIIFLRKIVRGAADDSYGIEVAALAGVPNTVVHRAKQILAELIEEGHTVQRPVSDDKDDDAISFVDLASDAAIEKIKNTDLNMLTPYEAMSLLYELKKMVE